MAQQQERTRCYGRVLELSRGRGWILPLQEIAHPAAGWNRGHIYLTSSDIRPGFELRAGDLVAFHLYADKKGLGAEDCFAVRLPAEAAQAAQMAAAAAQATAAAAAAASGTSGYWPSAPQAESPQKPWKSKGWWNQAAQEQKPKPSPWAAQPKPEKPVAPPPGLDAHASEYASAPPGFAPRQDMFSVNVACLYSDDEDEEDTETVKMIHESDGTQSVCGSVSGKSTKSSMCDASTCAGLSGGRTSVAESEWSNSPKTPAVVVCIEKALETGAAADVFSDDGDDEEPAVEPTPESSAPPSPKPKEFDVPDPVEESTTSKILPVSRILPAGYKVYQI
jgi:hypothetical protein